MESLGLFQKPDRLLEHEIVEAFFMEAMTVAERTRLLSREHFSVDGTPIQAWASHKRFRPRDGSDEPSAGGTGRNAQADFKGKRRCNDTRASTTDPDSRLCRKGKPAILAYRGHVLMENRSGLAASTVVTHADGFGERAAAQAMLDTMPGKRRHTLCADKVYCVFRRTRSGISGDRDQLITGFRND